jgi:hypothetical protein
MVIISLDLKFLHHVLLTSRVRGIGAMLTPDEAEFFSGFIRAAEIQKICHPLYGALLFSPLYLLSHRKLTSNAWDQGDMLKV